ncbi:hypothetical protein QJQ45_007642 [Haematococcus lacustris]|nr:hypothetical protein QJQ45_007642 [Haematococcus lacustris]
MAVNHAACKQALGIHTFLFDICTFANLHGDGTYIVSVLQGLLRCETRIGIAADLQQPVGPAHGSEAAVQPLEGAVYSRTATSMEPSPFGHVSGVRNRVALPLVTSKATTVGFPELMPDGAAQGTGLVSPMAPAPATHDPLPGPTASSQAVPGPWLAHPTSSSSRVQAAPPPGVWGTSVMHSMGSQQGSPQSGFHPSWQPAPPIPLPQLTHAIMCAEGPEALADLLHQHHPRFNHIHVSALLTRLADCCAELGLQPWQGQAEKQQRAAGTQHTQQQQQQQGRRAARSYKRGLVKREPGVRRIPGEALVRSLLPLLLSLVSNHLRGMGVYEVSGVMAAGVRLQLPVNCMFYIKLMEQARRTWYWDHTKTTPQGLAQLIWAVQACGIRSLRSDWAASFLTHAAKCFPTSSPQPLARMLHALAWLRCCPPEPWLAAFTATLLPQLPSAQPQDLSGVLWALVRLQPATPAELVPALLAAAVPKLPTFKDQELALLVWATARLGASPPPDLMAGVWARVDVLLLQRDSGEGWAAQGQAQQEAVVAEQGVGSGSQCSGGSSSAGSRQADRQCVRGLGALSPQAVAMLLQSCSLLLLTPPPDTLARLCAAALASGFAGFPPQAAAMLVHALAELGHHPGQGWLEAFHAWLEAGQQEWQPHWLQLVRAAFRSLGYRARHPQWQARAHSNSSSSSSSSRGSSASSSSSSSSGSSSSGSSGAGVAMAPGAAGSNSSSGPGSRGLQGQASVSSAPAAAQVDQLSLGQGQPGSLPQGLSRPCAEELAAKQGQEGRQAHPDSAGSSCLCPAPADIRHWAEPTEPLISAHKARQEEGEGEGEEEGVPCPPLPQALEKYVEPDYVVFAPKPSTIRHARSDAKWSWDEEQEEPEALAPTWNPYTGFSRPRLPPPPQPAEMTLPRATPSDSSSSGSSSNVSVVSSATEAAAVKRGDGLVPGLSLPVAAQASPALKLWGSAAGPGPPGRPEAGRPSAPLLSPDLAALTRGGQQGQGQGQQVQQEAALTPASRDEVLTSCVGAAAWMSLLALFLRAYGQANGAAVPGADEALLAELLGTPFGLGSWGNAGLVAAGVGLVTAARLGLQAVWPELRLAAQRSNAQILSPLSWPDMALVALLSGIPEELLFRGGLIPVTSPDWRGVVLSGLVFGALHNGGGRNWAFAAWASAVGCLYGALFLFSHNIWVPAAAHAAANFTSAAIWRVRSKADVATSQE